MVVCVTEKAVKMGLIAMSKALAKFCDFTADVQLPFMTWWLDSAVPAHCKMFLSHCVHIGVLRGDRRA